MALSLDIRKLTVAGFLLAALCLFAFGTGEGQARSTGKLGAATALKPLSPAAAKCRKLALNRAHAVANRAARPVAKRASRRAQVRFMRRCMRQQRSKRPKTGALATDVNGPLVIGIDGGYTGWSDTEVEERQELDAAVTRHEWDPSEPVDDQDDVMEVAAGEIHTRIHALLGGNQLGDPTHYKEWVIEFIHRYGQGGSFWAEHPEYDASRYAITSVELGNEPYFGEMSADEYAATVRPVLEEIKRLGLPVTVVLPSRVYGSNTSWMDTLYADIPNLNELFDAFAEHPYWYGHDPSTGGPAGPFDRIETTRQRMNEHGANTKPIWITEYGESTADCGEECVTEETQAAHLQEMLAAIVSHPEWGVKMLSVFQLRDRGTDSGDRERQFGLIQQDGTPKPSYGIVAAAMQQYRG
jgi:putative glycosyl hydrolase